MLGAIRRFVRQFPLAVVGLCMLGGTGVTTAAALHMNPPRFEERRETPRRPRPAPPAPEAEAEFIDAESP